MRKKGALFFTVDTLIAGLIFTMTVIVVLSVFVNQPVVEDTSKILENYDSYVTQTKMDRFRNVYRNIYDDPNEQDPDMFVFQKVAKLWDSGSHNTAQGFVENFTKNIVPVQFGIMYKYGDYVVYERPTTTDEYARTNLTSKLLTYYTESGTVMGPNVTSISIWS